MHCCNTYICTNVKSWMQVQYMTSGDSILSFFFLSASGAILSSLALLSCVLQSCLKPFFCPTLKPTNTYSTFMCLKSLPITSKSENLWFFFSCVLVQVAWLCKPQTRALRPLQGLSSCRRCAVMVRVINWGDVWCDYINNHMYRLGFFFLPLFFFPWPWHFRRALSMSNFVAHDRAQVINIVRK